MTVLARWCAPCRVDKVRKGGGCRRIFRQLALAWRPGDESLAIWLWVACLQILAHLPAVNEGRAVPCLVMALRWALRWRRPP